jgi:hypothetical protein
MRSKSQLSQKSKASLTCIDWKKEDLGSFVVKYALFVPEVMLMENNW